MRPCSRVGIDTTWKCNARCGHCFYLRNPKFHSGRDEPIGPIEAKIQRAHAAGLDHVLFVGYGEPSLDSRAPEIVDLAHRLGMATSMITNGATGLDRFRALADRGMDHFHISSHGLGDTMDRIMRLPGAFRRQAELKEWLFVNGVPFRTNVTMQAENFRELPELARYEIGQGVFHFVFLGFLPHYEWKDHLADIAVDPRELRPYIERGAEELLAAGTLFTIRYHPLCCLDPRYWPYVVNARYVIYDPWEWNYVLTLDSAAVEREAVVCGGHRSIQEEPCRSCLARQWCGGWDRLYASAFPGCVQAVRELPDRYAAIDGLYGAMHDLNPANRLSGTTGRRAVEGDKLKMTRVIFLGERFDNEVSNLDNCKETHVHD